MQVRIEEGYATRAIAQSGNEIWRVPDYSTVILTPTTVAGGTFKVYGSPDYDSRNPAHVADPTLATWVALPSTNFAGTEVAAGGVITAVAATSIVFSCAGFPHVRAVEQGAGTASLLCRASTFGISDVLGSVAAVLQVGHGKTLKTVSGTLTADTDVVAAVASKRIKVVAYSIIVTDNTADVVIMKSNGTAGTELWRWYVRGPDASTPFGANLAVPAPSFLFATVAGEKLTMDVSSGATIHYSISYFDDDAV